MIELLFIACVSGAPETCQERSLLFTDISPQQCLVGAQPELAKWVASHHGARIKSWRCQQVDLTAQDA